MSPFVLDTDTLSLLAAGHPGVTSRALAYPVADLAVTIITVEEVFIGRYTQARRARNDRELSRAYQYLFQVVELFRRVHVLPFDDPALARFRSLRPLHRRMATNDLRIAAIASIHGATLVTRNLADFQSISSLTITNWAD